MLSKETSKYTLDAGIPGLLNIPLDAFANVNKGNDVKLSIDGKKLAIGLGDNGDGNLGGSPSTNFRRFCRCCLRLTTNSLSSIILLLM
jgi:hypothetical protein